MTPEAFIRKICHDLRAPLRALKELPEWLEEDLQAELPQIPCHISETTGLMKQQAQRLDMIVEGLSELAKLKRTDPKPQTDLAETVQSIDRPSWMTIEIECGHFPMETDHLTRVVAHLLQNAIQHGGDGLSCVRLAARRTEAGAFEIAVDDDGVGIAAEHREAVYAPLATLRPRDDVETAGMGLAVVQRIAELYEGAAGVNTSPLGGARSWIRVAGP